MLIASIRYKLFPYTTLFRSRIQVRRAVCTVANGKRKIEKALPVQAAIQDPGHYTLRSPGRTQDHGCLSGRREPNIKCIRVSVALDRKSTRLNSSHVKMSYAV